MALAKFIRTIFRHATILSLAQNETDARLIVGMADQIVDRRKIEIHLASEFMVEGLRFQIDDHIGATFHMVEE